MTQVQDYIQNPNSPEPIGDYSLGMPHMLFGGLSERWLLKESGDVHWRLICRDLQTLSGDLTDALNERLYASFLRVRIESNCHFQHFRENDPINLTILLSRFGNQRFYSSLLYRSANREIRCLMNTVFISREFDNKSLARSKPQQIEISKCYVHDVVPLFGQGYHTVKEAAFSNVSLFSEPILFLGNQPFQWNDSPKFSMEYNLNPYYDLNGVNLLYFASYARIHDVCERQYIHKNYDFLTSMPIKEDWAQVAAPLSRDIFYYGNADLSDIITFRLYSCEFVSNHVVKMHSALFRKGDQFRIADIFTLKQLADPSSQFALLWDQEKIE
jgi:probable biosynthetic protein (TIGR04098 family)